MSTTPIDGPWTLTFLDGPVPSDVPRSLAATVPGCVHTDLLAAGLIPDPYLDRNEQLVQWVGECDVAYSTSFDVPTSDHERVDLVVRALDTVATLVLNGTEVGRTRNQHRSFRFDVRDVLQGSGEELQVRFDSGLRSAREAEQRLGSRPVVGNDLPYNAIRKMACNFGWDWGPVLVTAGIGAPVTIEAWSGARLASVVPLVTVDEEGAGRVQVRADVEWAGADAVTVEARLVGPGGVDEVAEVRLGRDDGAVLDLEVHAPELWWPRGHGDQPLYDLEVTLTDGDRAASSWRRAVGFRTVRVVTEPDEHGVPFRFEVNGRDVFVKGANWIPDDCFTTRVTAADYGRGVDDAVGAGMNMLRIWGGGLYESDALYDLCDRAGLMVWQDFPFACAAYAESEELWDEVEAEARENVARLAPHPSLVLWNGGNENVEGYHEWGWKQALGEGVDWGEGYYEDLLPRVVAEVDPTRAYIPSSPFSPGTPDDPRKLDDGPVHLWEVWNRRDWTAYREGVPRFVSEFGFQAPPTYATLTRAVPDAEGPESPGVLWHQKAQDGNGKLERGLAPHLPVPQTLDEWLLATQLNQAHAITHGIEHFRAHWPRTGGHIIWQLNDCWPVTSWAAVDGDGRRKPLWFALRRLNQPRLLMLAQREDGWVLVASNDSGEEWSTTVELRRTAFDGDVLASAQVPVVVPARRNVEVPVPSPVAALADPTAEVLLASAPGSGRAVAFGAPDKDLWLAERSWSATVSPVEGGYEVVVQATSLTKDLVLQADRVHPGATVDDQLITLLAGESHVFRVASPPVADPAGLGEPPALAGVAELLHARRSVPS